MLITQLPVTSRLQTALRDEGGEAALPWAAENYQLADVLDALHEVAYLIVATTGAKVRRPARVTRPGAQRGRGGDVRGRAELLIEMREGRRTDG